MTSDTIAYVEFDIAGPIRIFRNKDLAVSSEAFNIGLVRQWSYSRAVKAIRRRVFERDGWACVHCSEPLTWQTAHMHERQSRGDIQLTPEGYYSGGEISLENSITLCSECHLHDKIAGHGNRQPRFGETTTGTPE